MSKQIYSYKFLLLIFISLLLIIDYSDKKILAANLASIQDSTLKQVLADQITDGDLNGAFDHNSVDVLNLSGLSGISNFNGMELFTGLDTLYLNSSNLTALPNFVSNLPHLKYLDIADNQISSLPDSFSFRSWLKVLNISNNSFTTIPNVISTLNVIEELDISWLNISEVPDFVFRGSLQKLDMVHCNLTSFPNALLSLVSLRKLNLNENSITNLPSDINRLSMLNTLYLRQNKITSIPDNIVNMTRLRTIELNDNMIYDVSNDVFSFLASANLDAINISNQRFSMDLNTIDNSNNLDIENIIGLSQYLAMGFDFEFTLSNNNQIIAQPRAATDGIALTNDDVSIDKSLITSDGDYVLVIKSSSTSTNILAPITYNIKFKVGTGSNSGQNPGEDNNQNPDGPGNGDPNNTGNNGDSTISNNGNGDQYINNHWYDKDGNNIDSHYKLINGIWYKDGIPITGNNILSNIMIPSIMSILCIIGLSYTYTRRNN